MTFSSEHLDRDSSTSQETPENPLDIEALERAVADLNQDIGALRTELTDLVVAGRPITSSRTDRVTAGTTFRDVGAAFKSWAARRKASGNAPLWALALLVMIMGYSMAIRLDRIDSVPANITADEKDNLLDVISIQEVGRPGLFEFDWKPGPAFSVHLIDLSTKIFGVTPLGLRFPSMLLSTLALIPFFALARRVVTPVAALAAAAMLSTNLWYVHFSRSGWENVQAGFFGLFAAWALTVALEKLERRWFALAGFGAALGLYGYFSGRLVLPGLLAYLPFALYLQVAKNRARNATIEHAETRSGWRVGWSVLVGFAIMSGVAIALYLPQLRTIRERWDFFNQRVRVVSIFSVDLPYLGNESMSDVYQFQFRRMLDGYFLNARDLFNNGRYGPPNLPLFDTITWCALVVGLVIGIYRWKKTALWFCVLFVPLIGTQVFTIGTPDAARSVSTAPFFFLFVALAIDAAYRPMRSLIGPLALIPVIALIVLVNVGNRNDYFQWQATTDAAKSRAPSLEYWELDMWVADKRCALQGKDFQVDPDNHFRCEDR